MNYAKNLSVGNEVVVQTSDGNCFKGILMNIEKGYLSAIAELGVIHTFPLISVTNVIKA